MKKIKQKEADCKSLRTLNKILLPINNLDKLFKNILLHNDYKINKGRC